MSGHGEFDVYEIRVAVMATPDEVNRITDEIGRLLSPDPESAKPDKTPWMITIVPMSRDDYPDLLEQREIESRHG